MIPLLNNSSVHNGAKRHMTSHLNFWLRGKERSLILVMSTTSFSLPYVSWLAVFYEDILWGHSLRTFTEDIIWGRSLMTFYEVHLSFNHDTVSYHPFFIHDTAIVLYSNLFHLLKKMLYQKFWRKPNSEFSPFFLPITMFWWKKNPK